MSALAGKRIIVTGANRGIGWEVCRQLLGPTHSARAVILACRDLDAGRDAAAALRREFQEPATEEDSRVQLMRMDYTDAASIQDVARQVTAKFKGQLDGLVNNGAIFPSSWDAETYATCLHTNYLGPMQLTLALAPLMAHGGAIVQVSSSYGKLSFLTPDYADRVTKAGSLDSLWSGCEAWDPSSPMKDEHKPCYKISKAMLNRGVQLLHKSSLLTTRALSINSANPGHCRTRMGGPDAPRSAAEGADSVLHALALAAQGVSGKFLKDGVEEEW